MFNKSQKLVLPTAEAALPGRITPMSVNNEHFIHGRTLLPPFPDFTQSILLGLGCFWGAERLYWSMPGIYTTAVGYAGGYTPNPTYEEVCSGLTGHAEVVLVVYDVRDVSLEILLKAFWEAHDPTQGMRQGNDIGTQYRSAVYCNTDEQLQCVLKSRDAYQQALNRGGKGSITTEIEKDATFYYAEDVHQQYLGKNPFGYCGLRGTGVNCPV